jgi:LysR family transcriptional activator of mexEF-oprN operon
LDFPSRPTIERYLAEEHVIVSYNGDLRGVVEDLLGLRRKVRISVPTFAHVGAAVDGTGLLATVPDIIARDLIKTRPHLRTALKPFSLSGTPMELLWRSASEGDGAVSFVRKHIERIAAQIPSQKKSQPRHKTSKKI